MAMTRIVWAAVILAAATLAAAAGIITATATNTDAVRDADYRACIIAAAEHVDPSDYGADTAHNIAQRCHTIIYSEQVQP